MNHYRNDLRYQRTQLATKQYRLLSNTTDTTSSGNSNGTGGSSNSSANKSWIVESLPRVISLTITCEWLELIDTSSLSCVNRRTRHTLLYHHLCQARHLFIRSISVQVRLIAHIYGINLVICSHGIGDLIIEMEPYVTIFVCAIIIC
jgi:hypothetical protein